MAIESKMCSTICRPIWSACTRCGCGTPCGWPASTRRLKLCGSGRLRSSGAGRAGRRGVELSIGAGRPPVQVHAGDCCAAGKRRRPVDRVACSPTACAPVRTAGPTPA
ncbi:DUF6233 domain-containing protein [Streptomyces sp. NPDC001027]|uniref:DUF6233 domain-containing protein n=1 Tax=Streptomyces sp. NPDC001027 TaxID=3154771 RepID=UPI00332BC467